MITHTQIIIIGAGFAGLGVGLKLRESGHEDFLILERQADVGGVWYKNTYPGIACDVPSHFYSFSFLPKSDWSKVVSPGGEIQAYLRSCAEDRGLIPFIRFNTNMLESRWDRDEKHWVVKTSAGTYVAKILIAAAGHLADPSMPKVDGIESFTGDFFHSAQWNHSVDLKGKRIGVVGSGASAIQIVPEMQKIASELVVFQRSAPYMNPRNGNSYSKTEKRTFERCPEVLEHLRAHIFWFGEAQFAQRRMVPAFLEDARRVAITHMESQVADPELRKKLTPDYEIGCKRRLSSSDYYPAVAADNVTVEASALARIDGCKAYGASGNSYELDALVFATGFEAIRPPFAKHIFGISDISLDEHWTSGMQANDTVSVSGFPNLFIMYGPNTGLGHNSSVYIIEAQVDYVISAIDYFYANAVEIFEAKSDVEERYMDHLHALAEGSVWLDGGCKSWYVDERSGRLTVVWPDFAYAFREENGEFKEAGYTLST